MLVKRIEAETKTAGGLFLPDTAKEKPQEAEVISVGTVSYTHLDVYKRQVCMYKTRSAGRDSFSIQSGRFMGGP